MHVNIPPTVSPHPFRFFVLLLTALMIPPPLCAAVRGRIPIDVFAPGEMISKCYVCSTFQDKKGFIWFGTTHGLYRYDGHDFKHYLNEPGKMNSLSHNHIWSILQDQNGDLWISTFGGGLNRYVTNENRFECYRHNPDDFSSINSDYTTALLEDRSGNIWVGTISGLNVLNLQNKRFEGVPIKGIDAVADKDRTILSLYQDTAGVIWVGSENGLYRYSPQEKMLIPFPDNTDPFSRKLSQSPVRSFYEDSTGYLWIGTVNNGLYRYDSTRKRGTEVLLGHPENAFTVVNSILQDNYGTIWIATTNGLYTWPGPQTVENSSTRPVDLLCVNRIRLGQMYMDRFGTLWFAFLDGGIGKSELLDCHQFFFFSDPNGLKKRSSLFARDMCEDKYGNLWAVSDEDSGSLLKIDPKNNSVSIKQLPVEQLHGMIDRYNFHIRAVVDDHQGEDIKIALRNGQILNFNLQDERLTAMVNPSMGFLSNPETTISDILVDGDGDMWMSDKRRVIRLSSETGHAKTYGEDTERNIRFNGSITVLYWGAQTGLWAATADGQLFRFDAGNDSFVLMRNGQYLKLFGNHVIYTVFEDRQGSIWLGTDNGLVHMDPYRNTIIRRYDHENGLQGNMVKGIAQDALGNLWLGTMTGLVRLEKDSNRFVNFGALDIQIEYPISRIVTGKAMRTRDGNIFFISLNAIIGFNPETIARNPYPPGVAILQVGTQTGFSDSLSITGGNDVTYPLPGKGNRLMFPFRMHTLYFTFTALHFSDPERNTFAVKLEGVDQNWLFIGNQHEMLYPNLNPGNYVFRVKAANSQGVWNETGKAVEFMVLKPYWQTWWFGLAGILFAGILIFGIAKLQTFRVDRKNRILEKRVAERTRNLDRVQKELLLQEKLRSMSQINRLEKDINIIGERTRRQLGEALHDDLCPHLMGVEAQISALTSQLTKQSSVQAPLAKEIRESIQEGIRKARNISRVVAPDYSMEKGLRNALESLAAHVEETFDVECKLYFHGDVEILDHGTEIDLYLIVQEAVYNAIKHGKPRRIDISITVGLAGLETLTIIDDGCGIENNRLSSGMGLRIMKFRAQRIGASLAVTNGPLGGAMVELTLKNDG